MSSAPLLKSRLDIVTNNVSSALATQSVPTELQDALVEAVSTMSKLYMQNDLRPSELNAGDFIEATVRILQWLATGKHTPLEKSLPPMPTWVQNMESSSLNDSLRITIPKLINAMYTVRSRRGVSHIAGEVSANKVDAMLLLTTSRWILAEFVRLYHKTSHDEAQRAVDLLALAETPIIEDFEGVRRVITAHSLTIPAQIMLLLLNAGTTASTLDDMVDSIQGTPAAIRKAARRLHVKKYAHIYTDNRITLTGLGRTEAVKLMEEALATKEDK